MSMFRTTAKTNKVNVRNGSCKWPDPIYETTRLLQDAKTKTYDEKLYKLLVATGSSRSQYNFLLPKLVSENLSSKGN
ncbi:uncharacterized protein LOC121988772 isoform X6 [Zingiber officinale]|uniref:uncharacterized protein LOC121988772 isoform X6 n=1 Tax=Zingiber officinale TaxID=94328 RepID=UPI001C4D367E|nr:uncharacterized protein LOC121988772 isoform X6 [Zingiber officinale]